MKTWWVRNLVCSSADQSVGKLLKSSGAAVKRSRLEARNGTLILVWTLEYLLRPWNHVETKRCHLQQRSGKLQWYLHLFLHLHIHLNWAVMDLKFVDKECMRKHSQSDPFAPKLAELLDALRVRLLVLGSHTLENAKHIKMPGRES